MLINANFGALLNWMDVVICCICYMVEIHCHTQMIEDTIIFVSTILNAILMSLIIRSYFNSETRQYSIQHSGNTYFSTLFHFGLDGVVVDIPYYSRITIHSRLIILALWLHAYWKLNPLEFVVKTVILHSIFGYLALRLIKYLVPLNSTDI